ncbi:hypothetical protein [Nocardiopsis changdeensis]
MSEQALSEIEFDDLFDLTVTEVGDGAAPFVIIGEGCGGSYSYCQSKCA